MWARALADLNAGVSVRPSLEPAAWWLVRAGGAASSAQAPVQDRAVAGAHYTHCSHTRAHYHQPLKGHTLHPAAALLSLQSAASNQSV